MQGPVACRLLSGLSIDGVPVNSLLCFDIITGRLACLVGFAFGLVLGSRLLLARTVGHHVDMQIVESRLGLHPQLAWLGRFDFGMLAAAVVQGNHAAVIRTPLVGAHAEHTVEFARERHEETTGGAQVAFSGFGAQCFGASRTFIPALGSLRTTQRGQHVTAGQSEGLDGVVDILQRGFLDFAFLDALVIRIGTDRIGGSQIRGLEAILPRNPLGRHQRALSGDQGGFVDGPGVDLLVVIQRHRPLPSFVATDIRGEAEVSDVILKII